MVTSASAWQGKIQVEGTDLPLPSGNTARVRQIDPTAFISSGMIPDPLTALVRQAINNKKGLPPSALNGIANDPAQLSAALEMFDRVLTFAVLEPGIEMPPACMHGDDDPCGEYANKAVHQNRNTKGYHKYQEGPRDPEVLYADQVQMDDKMFIFNWALGGTKDLTSFREQLQGTVESVQHSQAVPGKAKRPARARG